MPQNEQELLRKQFDFRWEVLDCLIGGKSLIDSDVGLTGFPMRGPDDAARFVRGYGFDLDDPIEKAELFGNFHEAINFIRKFFLQPENPAGLKLEVPRKILETTDLRDLLLMAGMGYTGQQPDKQGVALRSWACAILKVVHSIAHLDKDARYSYYPEIQKQIFDRFYKVVHRDPAERLFLGESAEDPLRVNLVAFETKPNKTRESALIKLLHKPENVAEDIFDRVGIRFVTETRLEALRVVKYLKDSMVVMPANIKPSRSRNTIVNMAAFREALESARERIERGAATRAEVEAELEAAANAPIDDGSGANPHSSRFYRAIQFTCRQLIKISNPVFEDVRELRAIAKAKTLDESVQKVIERLDPKFLQREVRFFYPYEVQVLDRRSAEENDQGRSAHHQYKMAQLETALRRVMGSLADGAR